MQVVVRVGLAVFRKSEPPAEIMYAQPSPRGDCSSKPFSGWIAYVNVVF